VALDCENKPVLAFCLSASLVLL